MSVILMTTLFYKALILQGEIWCWSLLGLKGLNYYWLNKNCTYMTVFIPDSCCIACSIHPTRTAFLIDEEAKILYTPLWANEPESKKKRKWFSTMIIFIVKVPQVMNITFLLTTSIQNFKEWTFPSPVILPPIFQTYQQFEPICFSQGCSKNRDSSVRLIYQEKLMVKRKIIYKRGILKQRVFCLFSYHHQ